MRFVLEGNFIDPNLKRILLWEGFEGHPLRKDWHEPYYEQDKKPFGSRWPYPESPRPRSAPERFSTVTADLFDADQLAMAAGIDALRLQGRHGGDTGAARPGRAFRPSQVA